MHSLELLTSSPIIITDGEQFDRKLLWAACHHWPVLYWHCVCRMCVTTHFLPLISFTTDCFVLNLWSWNVLPTYWTVFNPVFHLLYVLGSTPCHDNSYLSLFIQTSLHPETQVIILAAGKDLVTFLCLLPSIPCRHHYYPGICIVCGPFHCN